MDGCAAIGVIMRDSTGTIMAGLSGKLPISLASAELAEAFGNSPSNLSGKLLLGLCSVASKNYASYRGFIYFRIKDLLD